MFNQVKIPLKFTATGVVTNTDSTEFRFKKFLRDKVNSIKKGLEPIHTDRLIKWRKNYEGIPAETTREFPFHNASNLVVPIIAIHTNTLLARVMSAVIKTQPPWNVRAIAGIEKMSQAGLKLSGLSNALETFLSYIAYEPKELDLYRVYHEWMRETIGYGTSVIKSPIVRELEDYIISGDGTGTGSFSYDTRTVYFGPRPEKIRFDDFGIEPSAKTVESTNFKYHRIHLKREDLEYRVYRGQYDADVVKEILKSPDRTSPNRVQQSAESDAGTKTVSGYGWAEWDVYECWCTFPIDNKHYVKCIVWYHERTDRILRAVFNQYTMEPFIASRLFYRDDAFHGYGFCEMLEPIADELSQMHNQRRDNMTVSTTKFFLVDPDSKLHDGYRVFPSAMLPGLKDELIPVEMGTPQQITIDEERLTLELADKLTGVNAPIQGSGSGFNTKRGVYTAMGTLSLLQEGNTRTDLNITDIRDAVSKLGRLICEEYQMMGSIGDNRSAAFGEMTQKIEAALKAMEMGQMVIPVTAATSSVNKEVEKQNDIMISGLLNKHYQTVSGMMQSAMDPRVGPEIKAYIGKSILGADYMMKSIMRHFGYDEVDRLVPEAIPEEGQPQGQGQGIPSTPGGNAQPGPGGAPPAPGPGMPQGAPQMPMQMPGGNGGGGIIQ